MISWHCAQKHKIKKKKKKRLICSSLHPFALLHCTLFPLQQPACCIITSSILSVLLVLLSPAYIHDIPCSSLLHTDPARSGEEQPDPALLSEAGPAAAPGPGDQHRRAGSARLRRRSHLFFARVCQSVFWTCARNTPPPVCFQGDGAPVCARPTAGVCAARRRRGGGDSSC